MKRLFSLLLCFIAIFSLFGCGNDDKALTNEADSIPSNSIDVDLTTLSSTIVYSEVYNMMFTPEKYIGKTIKINGKFVEYDDKAAGEPYFACVIQDATACCAQGMEFVLTDDYKYPDDYPKPDEEITVIGTFDVYNKGGYTFCKLTNAKLL